MSFEDGKEACLEEMDFEPFQGEWIKVEKALQLSNTKTMMEIGASFHPKLRKYSLTLHVNQIHILTAIGTLFPNDNVLGVRIDNIGFLNFSVIE